VDQEDIKLEAKAKKFKTVKDENGVVFDGNEETRWKFDPEDLVIIGLDDVSHEDAALLEDGATAKIDERQVASVGRDGVLVDVLIVAKDLPGVRTVVKRDETGVLVPPKDVEALTTAFRDLLRDAPARQQMSVHARTHAEAYSWQHHVERLRELYRGVCASRS
jgi:hypothetical protein